MAGEVMEGHQVLCAGDHSILQILDEGDMGRCVSTFKT